jgi:hypothetical protein
MKKIFLLLAICLVAAVAFVGYSFRKLFEHPNHNISVRVSENERIYLFDASYNQYKTHRLQRLMDTELKQKNFFGHARIDAMVTLDDSEKTHFYVKSYPGSLYIKLNKAENAPAATLRLKDLGEKIKRELAVN